MLKKIKAFLLEPDNLLVAIIILSCSASFALGRLSIAPKQQEAAVVTHSIFQNLNQPVAKVSPRGGASGDGKGESFATQAQGAYVASKNGTKYHLPWCAGASQISEQNKIWFDSKEEAEQAGYTPAGNCKGI